MYFGFCTLVCTTLSLVRPEKKAEYLIYILQLPLTNIIEKYLREYMWLPLKALNKSECKVLRPHHNMFIKLQVLTNIPL